MKNSFYSINNFKIENRIKKLFTKYKIILRI